MLRDALVRLHIWIGERLGLTHYRNCHTCKHRADSSSAELVWCDLDLEEDGMLAVTDPCEAVWCDWYERRADGRRDGGHLHAHGDQGR
jgi:hypothetical protein